jgi:hypothetical protein
MPIFRTPGSKNSSKPFLCTETKMAASSPALATLVAAVVGFFAVAMTLSGWVWAVGPLAPRAVQFQVRLRDRMRAPTTTLFAALLPEDYRLQLHGLDRARRLVCQRACRVRAHAHPNAASRRR